MKLKRQSSEWWQRVTCRAGLSPCTEGNSQLTGREQRALRRQKRGRAGEVRFARNRKRNRATILAGAERGSFSRAKRRRTARFLRFCENQLQRSWHEGSGGGSRESFSGCDELTGIERERQVLVMAVSVKRERGEGSEGCVWGPQWHRPASWEGGDLLCGGAGPAPTAPCPSKRTCVFL